LKTGHPGALVLMLALEACTSQGGVRPSTELPAAARTAPQRYVVVTVRNPVVMPGTSATSTPRAYLNAGSYEAGSIARRTSRALAQNYHLQEVSSWPIALLDVHCLVYAIPQNADRDQLLAQLARDRRVESVQPLQTFGTQSNRYNDPYANLQHNIVQMQVTQAHAMSRGANVRVAIIDSGVAIDHPDLPTSTPSIPGELRLAHAPVPLVVMVLVCLLGWCSTVVAAAFGAFSLHLTVTVGATLILPGALLGLVGAATSVVMEPPSAGGDLLPAEIAGIKMVLRAIWSPALVVVGLTPLFVAKSAFHRHAAPAAAAISGSILPLMVGVLGLGWLRFREDVHEYFTAPAPAKPAVGDA